MWNAEHSCFRRASNNATAVATPHPSAFGCHLLPQEKAFRTVGVAKRREAVNKATPPVASYAVMIHRDKYIVGTGGLAAARSRSGENDYQSFSNTLAPLRYPDGPITKNKIQAK